MNSSDPESKKQLIFLYRIVLCIACWTAMIISIWQSLLGVLDGGSPIDIYGNMFSYFTIQTNLFVMIWLTIAIIYINKDEKPRILDSRIHGAIMSYITVTFVVFALLLSSLYQPTGIDAVTNILMHYFIPIAFIIEWFLTESDIKYEWSYIAYWMVYPFAYLGYTLIRGYFTGFYPYYFIDLNYISILNLIVNVIGLTLFFFVLGCLYIALNRKIGK